MNGYSSYYSHYVSEPMSNADYYAEFALHGPIEHAETALRMYDSENKKVEQAQK